MACGLYLNRVVLKTRVFKIKPWHLWAYIKFLHSCGSRRLLGYTLRGNNEYVLLLQYSAYKVENN